MVLGATGFLGSGLVRLLAGEDADLRLVARRPPEVPAGVTAAVESVGSDLTDLAEVDALVRDADVVFPMVAAIRGRQGWRISDDNQTAHRIHVEVIERVAAVAEGAVVVFPGSNTQSGASGRIDGTEPDRPGGVYDRQKNTAEHAVLAADARGVVSATSVRFPPLFGPAPATAPDRGVVSSMARRALQGEALTVWGSADIRRDFLFVDDAARAMIAAWQGIDRTHGRHWVVGTGEAHTLGTVFATVAREVGHATGRARVPVVVVDPPERSEALDQRSVEPDPARFTEATGWRAEVALDDGVSRTVSHLIANP